MRKQIPRKYEDLLPSAQKQQQTNIKQKKKTFKEKPYVNLTNAWLA